MAAVLSLAILPVARAQEASDAAEVTLDLDTPAGCPSAAAVKQDIERLLGRPLRSEAQRPLTAHGEITEEDGVWRLRLRVAQGDASARQRNLAGDGCSELAQAAAVILALAIDPSLDVDLSRLPSIAAFEAPDASAEPGTAESSPAAAPRRSQPPKSQPPETQPTETQPLRKPQPTAGATDTDADRAEGTPMVWRLGAALLVDAYSLPQPAPGFALRGGFEWSPLRLELGGFHLLEQRSDPVPGGGVGIISLTAGTLHACVEYRTPRIAAGSCLVNEVGMLAARSDDVDTHGSGSSLWWGLGAGILGSWNVSRSWALEFGTELIAPMTSDKFIIERVSETVHRAPDWTIRGLFGASYRFR
jgi:hypothetical protein